MESMMTRVAGLARRMRSAASMPFMSGIATSRIATSGDSSSTDFTAALPPATQATISMSPWVERSAVSPVAISGWSSASRTRMDTAIPPSDGDVGALAGPGAQPEQGAYGIGALAHHGNAPPRVRGGPLRGEAPAVVGDVEKDA